MNKTLSGCIGKVVASHADAEVARSSPAEGALIYTMHEAVSKSQGVLPMRVRGATSKLDQPSLTLLSVADCG